MSRRATSSAPTEQDPPLTLHRHFVCGDGSLDWSTAFLRFIGRIRASDQAQGKQWIEWWKDPYVMGRLYAHFGAAKIATALAIVRDRQYPIDVQDRTGLSAATADRHRRQVMRRIRGTGGYLPYSDKPW